MSLMKDSTASLDLSLVSDVLTYLEDTPFASKSAVILSGGNTNFLFRLHLLEAYSGQRTLVLKHSKDFAAIDPSFKLNEQRQVVEAHVMKLAKRLIGPDTFVTIPNVYLHDPENNVIIMDDGGSVILKELMLQKGIGVDSAREVGLQLGDFLATLHGAASKDVQETTGLYDELLGACVDHEEGRRLTVFASYGRLVGVLEGGGKAEGLEPPLTYSQEEIQEVAKIVEERSKKIFEAKDVFTMGDLWPGNIIVQFAPQQINEDQETHERGEGKNAAIARVTLVDWEMAKPGLPGMDIGQFTAEMELMRSLYPDTEPIATAVLESFHEGYKAKLEKTAETDKQHGVDMSIIQTAAIHLGAHLAVWGPRIDTYRKREGIRDVVVRGIEYVLKGNNGDREWLNKSAVKTLS